MFGYTYLAFSLCVFRSKCVWAGHEMGTSLIAAGTWGRAKTNEPNSVEELNLKGILLLITTTTSR